MNNEEFWFVVALVEFVILVLIFGPKAFASRKVSEGTDDTKENQASKGNQGGAIGIIKNLRHTNIILGNQPVTIFEIHHFEKVLFAGFYDWVYDLSNGMEIEFWLSDDLVCAENIQNEKVEKDGITSRLTEKRRYLALTKYRIIPEEPETEHAETPLETISTDLEHELSDLDNWKPADPSLI